MTIEERYELSCYEELTKINDSKDIWLVKHNETGAICVKKIMELYNLSVYKQLSKNDIANIPKVLLLVEDEGKLIIIEEYIHGKNLSQILDEDGAFSEERVVSVTTKLCDILNKLHSCEPPIIHRDIKPSNIMLTNDNNIKLIDFNAAREFSDNQSEDTRLLGTRKFAAPEQYGFGQSDKKTDIYALGATMYYLLTKDFPENKQYAGKLLPIIEKCMDIDKERRYQDTEELKCALADNSLSRKLYKNNTKLPVGFRSGILWKKIIAVIGYMIIAYLCLTSPFKDSEGALYTGYKMIACRVASFFMLIGTIFFIADYCNIKAKLPYITKNKALHAVQTALYILLYYCIIALLLSLFII